MPGANAPTGLSWETEFKKLEGAFDKWDADAVQLQRRHKRFGFCAALLGPVAVLLLTVQVLAFPHGGGIAITLIFVEMAALCVVLVFGFFQIGNPDTWMHCRLRAELLRRERFLVFARVGPYLETPDPAHRIKQRLASIDNVNIDPVPLVRLENENGYVWHEALEDSRNSSNTASPEAGCIDLFFDERLLYQKGWFAEKSTWFGGVDERFENVAKGVLVAALVVSVWHLATLYFGSHGEGARTLSQLMIEVLAIVLPPVGSAATALQSLFEGRRLSRSYADRARVLTTLETGLLNLHQKMTANSSQTPAQQKECEFLLKRLVLRTEELLASDLLQWWLFRHS